MRGRTIIPEPSPLLSKKVGKAYLEADLRRNFRTSNFAVVHKIHVDYIIDEVRKTNVSGTCRSEWLSVEIGRGLVTAFHINCNVFCQGREEIELLLISEYVQLIQVG